MADVRREHNRHAAAHSTTKKPHTMFVTVDIRINTHTMPLAPRVLTRSPAYMAGDRSIQVSYSFHLTIVRSIETLRETARAECGAHSQDRSLFSMCVRREISSRSILAKSLGIGAPAATRTRDPRLRRPMRYPTELRARRSTVIASLNRYGAAALSSLLNPAAFIATSAP